MLNSSHNIDNALLGNLTGIIDHCLGNISTLEQAALNRVHMLTENDKTALSLVVNVEGASTKKNFLTNMFFNIVKTRSNSFLPKFTKPTPSTSCQ